MALQYYNICTIKSIDYVYDHTNNKSYSIMFVAHSGVRARVPQWVRELNYLTAHTSLSPIRRGFAPGFVNYKKGCTRLAAASDKVNQLLADGRWFSPGTPASSSTKTGRHYIAEILLKVALNTKKSNQIIIWGRNCLPFASTWVHHRSFGGVRFAHFFVLSYYVYLRSAFRVVMSFTISEYKRYLVLL